MGLCSRSTMVIHAVCISGHMLNSHSSINTASGALQAQREYPPSLEDVKDKFLVQSTIAPPDAREVGADTFDPATNKSIRQTKLRVLLVSTRDIVLEAALIA